MKSRHWVVVMGLFLIGATFVAGCVGADDDDNDAGPPADDDDDSDTTSIEALGKLLFFDTNLSTPAGQSCGSCHGPSVGFSEPDKNSPTSEGAVAGRFGGRNSQSCAYAAYSPDFHFDEASSGYVGGQFWDGRAVNLAEQAKGPFLNPVEMNNATAAEVVDKVRAADYAAMFEEVFGAGALDNAETAYDMIAEAIAAYEESAEVNPFSSKYDAYLAGDAELTPAEQRGLEIFTNPTRGNCASCHTAEAGPNGEPPLFTDYTYANVGTPKNPDNPWYSMPAEFNPDGADWVDLGLGGFLDDPAHYGKMKVPSLRNIDRTGPYMHNGVFDDLNRVLKFYCVVGAGAEQPADGMCGPCCDCGMGGGGCGGGGGMGGGGCGGGMGGGGCGGGGGMGGGGCGGDGCGCGCMVDAPEVPENFTPEMADVTITAADYEDLTAFLLTLTDGYMQ